MFLKILKVAVADPKKTKQIIYNTEYRIRSAASLSPINLIISIVILIRVAEFTRRTAIAISSLEGVAGTSTNSSSTA
jgi:hypothetical protein